MSIESCYCAKNSFNFKIKQFSGTTNSLSSILFIWWFYLLLLVTGRPPSVYFSVLGRGSGSGGRRNENVGTCLVQVQLIILVQCNWWIVDSALQCMLVIICYCWLRYGILRSGLLNLISYYALKLFLDIYLSISIDKLVLLTITTFIIQSLPRMYF